MNKRPNLIRYCNPYNKSWVSKNKVKDTIADTAEDPPKTNAHVSAIAFIVINNSTETWHRDSPSLPQGVSTHFMPYQNVWQLDGKLFI